MSHSGQLVWVLDNGHTHSDHKIIWVDASRVYAQELIKAWLALANFGRVNGQEAWAKWSLVAEIRDWDCYGEGPLYVGAAHLVEEEFCRAADVDDEDKPKAREMAREVVRWYRLGGCQGKPNWGLESLLEEVDQQPTT